MNGRKEGKGKEGKEGKERKERRKEEGKKQHRDRMALHLAWKNCTSGHAWKSPF